MPVLITLNPRCLSPGLLCTSLWERSKPATDGLARAGDEAAIIALFRMQGPPQAPENDPPGAFVGRPSDRIVDVENEL